MKDGAERPFHIVVTERDSMTADLLASALDREGGCRAVAVGSGDLLSLLASRHADLAVISADPDADARTGYDLALTVSRTIPTMLVVMILGRSTPSSVLRAFRCGARGVVSREQPISVFLDCVDHVRRGILWASGKEADFLLESVRNMPAADAMDVEGASPLTDRELQVVQYAATGRTNKVIASELRLSEHTVKNYLFRAFEKLGVSSRVELLFYLTVRGHRFGPAKIVDIDTSGRELHPGSGKPNLTIGPDTLKGA